MLKSNFVGGMNGHIAGLLVGLTTAQKIGGLASASCICATSRVMSGTTSAVAA
ncbi:hypothetical protein C357_08715 [Citreicella sp. 357]|nr:hypothetical protein C357_08715 [Citreicella sp. 357]